MPSDTLTIIDLLQRLQGSPSAPSQVVGRMMAQKYNAPLQNQQCKDENYALDHPDQCLRG
jgi:hypothetical protein